MNMHYHALVELWRGQHAEFFVGDPFLLNEFEQMDAAKDATYYRIWQHGHDV